MNPTESKKTSFFDLLPQDIQILYAKCGKDPEKEILRILRAFAQNGVDAIPARILELEDKQILPGSETHNKVLAVLQETKEINSRAGDALRATEALSQTIRKKFTS